MRRRTLLGAVPGLVAATSGCVGVLTGSEALEREATTARVAEGTLSDTGYELSGTRSDTIEREVTVAGQTRTVVAVNQFAEYHRSLSLGPLGEGEYAVFSLVATPAFEIGGQVMSPVENWSNRKVATRIQRQYSNLEVGDEVDQRSVATLEGEMPLSTFEGTGTVAGNRGVDLFLHVGTVRHDGDFVFAVGVHPQALSGEGETVRRLVENLTHG